MLFRKGTGEKLAKNLKAAVEELKQLPPKEQALVMSGAIIKYEVEPEMKKLLPFNRGKIELHK